MDRRVSMLSLALLVAAGMLVATSAPAEVVDFDVSNHGVWYAVGFPSGWPVFEVYCVYEVDPNPFGITQMRVYGKWNYVTGEIWDGRDIYLTADGDALHARFHGWMAHDGVPQTLIQEFVGGTGRFAGARGSTLHQCHEVLVSPLHGTCSCASHGTLVLADLQSKMVPMASTEGDLVSLELQHVEMEAFGLDPLPVLAQKATHTAQGSHLGLYSTSQMRLLDFSTMGLYGFFTRTAADGDMLHGYYEGDLSELAACPDALGVDMQVWITGGTGRFANASGKQTGSGVLWEDGCEEIALEGVISSVGSSMR